MSGPIVRRYGFPNFEKIFGERGLKHGADSEATPSTTPADPPKPTSEGEPKKADEKSSKP